MSMTRLRSIALDTTIFLWASGAWPALQTAAAQTCASDGYVESLGLATLGSAGLPSLSLKGAPLVQFPFGLRVSGGQALGYGVLIASPNEAPVFLPQFGAAAYPGAPLFAVPFALDLHGASPALLEHAALPQETCGVTLVAQAALLDGVALGGAALTKAMRLKVGGFNGGPLFPGQRFPTAGWPVKVAIADLDGDHVPDLLSTNYLGPLHSVLLGSGDGTFGPEHSFGTSNPISTSLTAGDWNGDGILDLAADASGENAVAVHLGLGDGSFGPEALLPGFSVTGDIAVASGLLAGGAGPLLVASDSFADEVTLFRPLPDGTFLVGGSIPVGEKPMDVAFADLNGDGRSDIVTPNLDTDDVSLVFALAGGGFAAAQSVPCGNEPRGLALGDLDANGALDLVVTDQSPAITTLLGAGGGTFAALPPLAMEGLGRHALGDLDGDGRLDLVLAYDTAVGVHAGAGDGTFAPGFVFPSGISLAAPSIGDLDLDGNLDLALGDHFGGGIVVVIGLGAGTLATEQALSLGGPAYGATSIDRGDFDGDQITDLVVNAQQTDEVRLLRGLGDGSFGPPASFASGPDTAAIATGDLDGDGALDVAISTSATEGLRILPGMGDGTFGAAQAKPIGVPTQSLELADMDGDAVLDVVTVGSFVKVIAVALGAGDGSFATASMHPAKAYTYRAVPCDLDADGFLDVAACDVAGEGTSLITGAYSILLGNGDGTLGPAQQTSVGDPFTHGHSLAPGDLDEDGVQDLALAVGSGSLEDTKLVALLGVGDGTFQPGPEIPATWGKVAVEDLDADLHLDVVLLLGENVFVLPGLGDGSFGTARELPVRSQGRDIALGDWNGDLLPDLAAACAENDEVSVLINQLLR